MLKMGIVVAVAAVVAPTRLAAPRLAPRAPWATSAPVRQMVQDADGRLLYLKNCRTCHGATGQPNAENLQKYPKIKALNDAAFLGKLTDDSMLMVLKKGKGEDMKSWTDKLTPAEMRAVIKYVRSLPDKKK